jgi:two-component system, chemotaxis family, response regulator Rcp1
MKILILEDNPADEYLLLESLRETREQFTPLIFHDGESAYNFVQSVSEESQDSPDVAVLDLNVPKRDGSEVLACLRSHHLLSNIPIIVFSSYPRESMVGTTIQADCYIRKPSNYDLFLGVGKQIMDCAARRNAVNTDNDDQNGISTHRRG